jgi:hypothetical protein
MTSAPSSITAIQDVRGLYFRHALAEHAKDRDGQNTIMKVMDTLAWPLVIGGAAVAIGFPATIITVAAAEVTKAKGPQR